MTRRRALARGLRRAASCVGGGAAIACVVALAPLSPAWGQGAEASVAAGAASVRLVDGSAFTATTLSPAFSVRDAGTALFAQATFSRVSAAGWSTQGSAQLTRSSAVSPGGWMLEGEGRFAGSTFPGGASTAQGLAALRVYRLGTRVALWGGAGSGALYDGWEWRALRQAELGLSADAGLWRFAVTAQPTLADDTIRYLDGLATLATAIGAADVALSVGARGGRALPTIGGDRRAWGGGMLTLWLRPRVALQAAAGAYPVDVAQGFPAGEYVSVALQVGQHRRARAALQADARRQRAEARRAGLERGTVTVVGDDAVMIRVYAPSARRVELQADVTHWEVTRMRAVGDGWFELRLPRAGVTSLELAVRVDGGAWRAPPGTESVRDEFGGRSGRVLLP